MYPRHLVGSKSVFDEGSQWTNHVLQVFPLEAVPIPCRGRIYSSLGCIRQVDFLSAALHGTIYSNTSGYSNTWVVPFFALQKELCPSPKGGILAALRTRLLESRAITPHCSAMRHRQEVKSGKSTNISSTFKIKSSTSSTYLLNLIKILEISSAYFQLF